MLSSPSTSSHQPVRHLLRRRSAGWDLRRSCSCCGGDFGFDSGFDFDFDFDLGSDLDADAGAGADVD